MNHADHVRLLDGEPGLRAQLGLPLRGAGGTWADLGAGEGAFTLALAELVGPGAYVYAVDQDARALRALQAAMRSAFPAVRCQTLAADFTHALDLPPLDGLVMANALHFVPADQKAALLRQLKRHLRPSGQLILVEYDTDRGNRWVPYPLSFPAWQILAAECGYAQTTRLLTRPSSFLGAFFSSVSV